MAENFVGTTCAQRRRHQGLEGFMLNLQFIVNAAILASMLISCARDDVFTGGSNEERQRAIAPPIYVPTGLKNNERGLLFHGYYEATVRRKTTMQWFAKVTRKL